MAGSVSRRRCVVGRDVRVVDVRPGEVEIESALRLRPGAVIDVHDEGVRPAVVVSWAVTRLGSDGTVYRGRCRWLEPPG
jgi:hypothetical protein